MLNLAVTIEERAAYPLTPQKDRWIFNKLTVAEVMGHECAPSGTPMTQPGDYVIRPIMNCSGEGDGGVVYFTFDGTIQPVFYPGWFWCERFYGFHEWINYTSGLGIYANGGVNIGGKITLDGRTSGMQNLPIEFAGISKHMLVEYIDGNVIEVAPRHMTFRFAPGESDYVQDAIDSPYYNEAAFRWKAVPK